ncbi:MAG: PAS domain-containing protein [Pseudomonadales bacterium]
MTKVGKMAADLTAQQTEKDFFDQTDFNQILGVFDVLERTLVWVKNVDSRIMFANNFFIYQYGANSLEQLIGKNDYDFLPPEMARKFIDDDKKVLSGTPVRERLELNIQRSGEIAWFETSKFPLKSTSGKIIGTYGLSRRRDKVNIPLAAVSQLEASLDYIRSNYASSEISMLLA